MLINNFTGRIRKGFGWFIFILKNQQYIFLYNFIIIELEPIDSKNSMLIFNSIPILEYK